MKIYLGTLILVLGIVGILMDATGNLPPALDLPIVNTAVTILGILIVGLGWQDDLQTGKSGLLDLIKNFFAGDPFRNLGLTVLLVAANEIVQIGIFPTGLETGAQIFLAIAAVFGFSSGYAGYRVRLFALRSR